MTGKWVTTIIPNRRELYNEASAEQGRDQGAERKACPGG
jgi:hypothetical protein